MGVQDSFMGASVVAKVAFFVLLCANFFSWMAFTTTGWAVVDSSDTYFGIWRMCENDVSDCKNMDGSAKKWFVAFQAFSIFGFVLVNVCFVLVTFFIFMDKFKGDKEVGMAATVTGIAGGVTWLIAVIICGAKYDTIATHDVDLEYSFGLAIVALILSVVGGVAMLFSSGGGATKPSG